MSLHAHETMIGIPRSPKAEGQAARPGLRSHSIVPQLGTYGLCSRSLPCVQLQAISLCGAQPRPHGRKSGRFSRRPKVRGFGYRRICPMVVPVGNVDGTMPPRSSVHTRPSAVTCFISPVDFPECDDTIGLPSIEAEPVPLFPIGVFLHRFTLQQLYRKVLPQKLAH